MDQLQQHRRWDAKSNYDNVRNKIGSDKHTGYISLDGIVVAQTMQCCHGGEHWVLRPGSGEIRGFCRNCMQVTCGREECNACVPFEKKLEMAEQAERRRLEVNKWLSGA